MIVAPVLMANFTVVEDLDDTARGAGGFGSTGTR
jgi:dUTP pyrophosphatase